MRVAVIGTGHVGLVTAATFAEIGHDVVGVDTDEEKVARLRRGVCPFFEPGLQEIVDRGVAAGRLRFHTDAGAAVARAEAIFICVGTPTRPDGSADLLAVERAMHGIAPHLSAPVVVVEKSTVPAGTAGRLRQILARERPDLAGEIDVVSNPEFLREGQAVEDSLHPARILVGAASTRAFETMRRLYEPFIRAGHPLMETDIASAEIAKHACNAFLAVKISYANALARLCERSGADVVAVADVMGSDPRIGRAFLDAGLGYGGSCLPKDLQAFEHLSHRLGYDFGLLREVARINDEAVESAAQRVADTLWNLEDKRVALLGLSFKPGTDEVSHSPALALARILLERGATVVGYDPEAAAGAQAAVPGLEIAPTAYDAIDGAHCAVMCTGWKEIRSLDLGKMKELMAYPIVLDGRNLLDPTEMHEMGFVYRGTGRIHGHGALTWDRPAPVRRAI